MFHSYVSCLNHMYFNNIAWHDVLTEEANTILSCLSMHPDLLFKVHLPVVHASKPVIQSTFKVHCPCIQTCYSKYIYLLSMHPNLLFRVHLKYIYLLTMHPNLLFKVHLPVVRALKCVIQSTLVWLLTSDSLSIHYVTMCPFSTWHHTDALWNKTHQVLCHTKLFPNSQTPQTTQPLSKRSSACVHRRM